MPPSLRRAPLLLLVALAGCTPSPLSKRVAAFTTAATPVLTETPNAYQLVEQSYRDAQIAHMLATYDTAGFNPANLKPFLSPQDLQVRTDILDGLSSYTALLASVSGDDPLAGSNASMNTALQALSANSLLSAHFTAADASTAAAAIEALGKVLVDRRRRRELPAILHQMQQPIETICNLLEQDIGDPLHGGLRNELHNNYLDLVRTEKTFIADNGQALSPTEKRSEIRILPQLDDSAARNDRALAQTRQALSQLAQAHTALASTATQKDAPTFRLHLAQLTAAAGRLHDVYAATTLTR